MTTFHTDPNAGLPAPSDCEFEPTPKIPFNRAVTLLGITHEREQFHSFVAGAGPFTMDGWHAVFETFVRQNDEADLFDTGQDIRYAGCP